MKTRKNIEELKKNHAVITTNIDNAQTKQCTATILYMEWKTADYYHQQESA